MYRPRNLWCLKRNNKNKIPFRHDRENGPKLYTYTIYIYIYVVLGEKKKKKHQKCVYVCVCVFRFTVLCKHRRRTKNTSRRRCRKEESVNRNLERCERCTRAAVWNFSRNIYVPRVCVLSVATSIKTESKNHPWANTYRY